jgi:hypothetical protein
MGKKTRIFPNLIFCEQVEQKLQNLKIGDPILQQIKKRFLELEKYCQCWKNGAFNPIFYQAKQPQKVTQEFNSLDKN